MRSLSEKRSETRKISHNPEVSGSKLLPATKVKPRVRRPLQDASRGSGFSLPKGLQMRAWRTAVDIFPKMEEFLTRLCACA
jgi:hypothetical protein